MKMRSFLIVAFTIVLANHSMAQAPEMLWQKTYGGKKNDSLISILKTNDGGFLVTGQSNSDAVRKKSQNSFAGSFDYWILKLDSEGLVVWDKTIGANGSDIRPVAIEAHDGGFLIGGSSNSAMSTDKREDAINESYDFWVIKTDAVGNVLWENTIGGVQLEILTDMVIVPEGYMLGGYSHTNSELDRNDKTEPNRGSSLWADYWMVKIDKRGRVLWDKAYGGSNEDQPAAFKGTADGGFVFGGYSYSENEYEKSEIYIGNNDYWIVKTDAAGNKQWDKIYGGALSDHQTAIQQTADGGYILGGYSNSPISGNKAGIFKGVVDYWVIKIDANRNVIWDKTIGGQKGDYLTSIQQTADGGYIIGGSSNSDQSVQKSENSKGGFDAWIVKLDGGGNYVWDKTIGGSADDKLSMIKEISPDEFILGLTSNSPKSGDKKKGAIGKADLNDYWIIRLGTPAPVVREKPVQTVTAKTTAPTTKESPVMQQLTLQVLPNPVKNTATFSYSAPANAILSLQIYDNTGKVVWQQSLSGGKNNYSADLSTLSAGNYYAVITNGKNSVTRMLVKQ